MDHCPRNFSASAPHQKKNLDTPQFFVYLIFILDQERLTQGALVAKLPIQNAGARLELKIAPEVCLKYFMEGLYDLQFISMINVKVNKI